MQKTTDNRLMKGQERGIAMDKKRKTRPMVRTITILSLALMLALIPVFSGCTAKTEDTQTTTKPTEEKTTAVEATAEPEVTEELGSMEETLDVIWWGFNVSGYLPVDGSEIETTLEDRFNINIENVPVDNYNSEQVNVMLASGLEYDICTMPKVIADLYELGLLRSLPEEYISTYLPAQYDELVAMLGDGWSRYASFDGEIYGIPVISEAWTAPLMMGIRTDWLKAIGYSEDNLPTTLDGLEEMLLKLHTDDPDGNGQDDTYALDKFDDYYAYILGAYGICNDRYWYNDEDGKPAYYAVDENYKEALKVLQRWYAGGIYDPEVITDARTETTAKFIAGTVAGYYGIDWAFTLGHGTSPLKKAMDEGLDIEVTIIPPVTGPTGVAATYQYRAGVSAQGMTFGRNCTDEKLIRLMQVINAIFSEEDLFKYCMYGPKDIMYVNDENGYLETTETYSNETMSTYGSQRYLNYSFSPASILKWRTTGDRLEMFYSVKDFPKVPVNSVSVFVTDAESEYSASVEKIADEFFWKAFTGEIDIDAEWDGYVTRWLDAGGQEILDAKTELYESLN